MTHKSLAIHWMLYYITDMRFVSNAHLPVGLLVSTEDSAMSNRFNLSQFTVSLSTLTCARDEKPQALASFVAGSLRDAAQDWLIEGSDCLAQALARFEGAGKTAVAVKFRKIIRGCGASLMPYGEIDGLTLVKNKFPGGNGDLGRKDHDNRIAVCEQFHAKVYAYACFVFAPAVSDGAVDPLSSFGAFSEKSFAIKIASASVEQIEGAVKRTLTLTALLASALESVKKQNADDTAPVEASAPAKTRKTITRVRKAA